LLIRVACRHTPLAPKHNGGLHFAIYQGYSTGPAPKEHGYSHPGQTAVERGYRHTPLVPINSGAHHYVEYDTFFFFLYKREYSDLSVAGTRKPGIPPHRAIANRARVPPHTPLSSSRLPRVVSSQVSLSYRHKTPNHKSRCHTYPRH